MAAQDIRPPGAGRSEPHPRQAALAVAAGLLIAAVALEAAETLWTASPAVAGLNAGMQAALDWAGRAASRLVALGAWTIPATAVLAGMAPVLCAALGERVRARRRRGRPAPAPAPPNWIIAPAEAGPGEGFGWRAALSGVRRREQLEAEDAGDDQAHADQPRDGRRLAE